MKRLPDETGWYWAKDDNGEWAMAYVDTDRDVVYCFDRTYAGDVLRFQPDVFCLLEGCGVEEWYGPIACPGGDFGGHTVICDEELEQKAEAEKKVIGIQFFDFKHCSDEGHGSSLTVSGVYTRDEAWALMKREAE